MSLDLVKLHYCPICGVYTFAEEKPIGEYIREHQEIFNDHKDWEIIEIPITFKKAYLNLYEMLMAERDALEQCTEQFSTLAEEIL